MGYSTPYESTAVGTTSRGPSFDLWADCPWSDIDNNPTLGIRFFDDFVATPDVPAGAQAQIGIYKGFADTGGTVAEGNVIGGVKVLSSDGDNEGASLATVSKPFQIISTSGKFWFETRIKSSTITDTKHGIFVGLIDTSTLSATVPIAADGTLADENFVGFHRLEGDGDKLDFVYKADGVTQVTVLADAATVAADTWIKVGIKYDPSTNLVTHYVDGTVSATTYTLAAGAGDDFPNDVRLGLVIAVLNATATTPGTSSIDWWRAAQLFA